MTDRSSRFAQHPTYRRPLPGHQGEAGAEVEVELYEPRLRSAPTAALRHTITGADRLDLLAHRYLDDPHQYWRIADANPELELAAPLEPGRSIGIPRRPA